MAVRFFMLFVNYIFLKENIRMVTNKSRLIEVKMVRVENNFMIDMKNIIPVRKGVNKVSNHTLCLQVKLSGMETI